MPLGTPYGGNFMEKHKLHINWYNRFHHNLPRRALLKIQPSALGGYEMVVFEEGALEAERLIHTENLEGLLKAFKDLEQLTEMPIRGSHFNATTVEIACAKHSLYKPAMYSVEEATIIWAGMLKSRSH